MAGEGNLHKKCRDAAELRNVMFRKIKFEGRSGCPDVLLIFPNGTVVFIELKNPNKKGKLLSGQSRELRKMAQHNAHCYVCNSMFIFTQILDRFSEC